MIAPVIFKERPHSPVCMLHLFEHKFLEVMLLCMVLNHMGHLFEKYNRCKAEQVILSTLLVFSSTPHTVAPGCLAHPRDPSTQALLCSMITKRLKVPCT